MYLSLINEYFSNVTEQDLIILRKLAEQQKNQRTPKIKKRILKQTHDIKLAESLSPVTTKLDEVKESTKTLEEIFKEPKSENINMKALPNSSNFSKSRREMLGLLMNSRNSLKITRNDFGHANIFCVPIQILGADTIKKMKIPMN